MSGGYLVNVPRLKGRENYDDWAFAVENFLILEGLQGCIKDPGAEEAPTETKVAECKAKLILTIDTSLYVHIKNAKTANELWKTLKGMFDDKGSTRKITLLRTLISTRLEDCDSMQVYVRQIVETAQRLQSTGFEISEEWIGSLLLAGLPEKYSPMIMAIEHSGIQITADNIKSKLLDMEEANSAGNAFSARWRGQAGNANATNGNGVREVRDKDKKKQMSNIKCYHCKQSGHYKNKCPQLKKSDNKNDNTQKNFGLSAVFLSGEFNKDDWYVDSGASAHFVADEKWLQNTSNSENVKEIIAANKETMTVSCKGVVKIKTCVDNTINDVTIRDVFCVPKLSTNLLSVSQMIKAGNKVKFDEGGCSIYSKDNQLVGTATQMNNVYKLNIVDDESLLAMSTWHRKFGHANGSTLNQMMRNESVIGMKTDTEMIESKNNCIVCCEGKQTRMPFPKKGYRAECILGLVHMDVCGPIETRSIGGSRYFLIIVDDFSKMAFGYFLKSKGDVFNQVKHFVAMAENQTNCLIKIVRSDNGGEFCNKNFEAFFSQKGILHQLTTPYTPEQNGSAERMNRTVVEKAKCLMFDAKLDKRFWAEAINHAIYLRNRIPAAGMGNKTPIEIWTGRKPDVNNLCVFGSKAMVHVPKEKRLKLDRKSKQMIFVGFSDHTKGYRLYDPANNIVILSRDVIILEEDDLLAVKVTPSQMEEQHNSEADTSVGAESGNDDEPTEPSEIANSEESYIPDDFSDSGSEGYPDDVEEGVRKSSRTPKPKILPDYVTYATYARAEEDIDLEEEPSSVEEALARPDHQKWRCAMDHELSCFEKNRAWEVVNVPSKGTIVKCKWVFKRKCDGNEVRYRARLVAKGYGQQPGTDYNEIFSPVVRHSTLRLLFALSVRLCLKMYHLDVPTAFLNGDLDEEVFMMMPEGLNIHENVNKVLKLNKAIYGLKQASRAWNQKVNIVMKELNYQNSKYEPCLYTKRNDNGNLTIVALYVDDFFVFSNCKDEVESLKNVLIEKFRIKDLGELKHCLGMDIEYDKGEITLSQEKYIDQLLIRFSMQDCKTAVTPMSKDNAIEDAKDVNVPYQQLVGSLMYLAVLTRPDISYCVSFLSQFNNCHNSTHWSWAKRVLRYLKLTKDLRLKYTADNESLKGFADADWAGNPADRKSVTGYCFKLSGATISWESRKQTTVALSSTEAEYMALSEACKEAIYLRNLIRELVDVDKCVSICSDNQSAIKLSANPVFHKRSKHIDVRHHFVREAVNEKQIEVKYLSTHDMPSDVLTKALCSEKHNKFVKEMGLTR